MKLKTRHFGEIEIDESKIIEFDSGLPGFENLKRFALFSEDSDDDDGVKGLFWWLQSVDSGETAFVLMDVLMVKEDYDPHVNEIELSSLGEYLPDDLLTFNIAIIPENLDDLTVNLRAPIIINTVTKKGKQVVVNDDQYAVKHYIYKEITSRNK